MSEDGAEGAETGRGLGIAYAYLNRRERTVAEVRARLARAEVGAEETESVISELLEFGYLDDARYARVFTQDKRSLEAWGNERIARSLRERGVERDLIEEALAEDPAPADGGPELGGAVEWGDRFGAGHGFGADDGFGAGHGFGADHGFGA